MAEIVTLERNGNTHVAVYSSSDEMVHVTYLGAFRTTSTQLGGSTAAGLARIMLGEFADAKPKKPTRNIKVRFRRA